MAKLVSLELLDYIEKAELQGKSREAQCLEADYVTPQQTPNMADFNNAIDQAKRHVEIIRTGTIHPFLMHAYAKTPVTQKNKRLNSLIEEFSSLVSLVYIDSLEENFMDNFEETGDLDGELYEYSFGTFDGPASAKEYILKELDTDWWLNYFENEKEQVISDIGFKKEALSLMSQIEKQGGSDLLDQMVREAIAKRYEGILGEAGIAVSTDITIREWERGDLVKWLENAGWKHFCLSLRKVAKNKLSD